MKTEFQISYLPAESVDLDDLTYVIIGARENENWIFVRHEERKSWELPAGHIEKNETALEAAKRELHEETGCTHSNIRSIYDYSVKSNGILNYGRLFFAEIIHRGPLPDSEIAEIKIQKTSPEPPTYPEAHKSFIDVLEKFVDHLL